jgi:uncharacterized protein
VSGTGTTKRSVVIDPDRWRPLSDGPRWLYAAPGRLRASWRLAVLGLSMMVIPPIVESLVAPVFGAMSRAFGEPVPAYPWITMISVWCGIALALRVVDQRSWDDLGLAFPSWHPRLMMRGLLLGALALVGTVALLWISRTLTFESVAAINGATQQGAAAWWATALRLTALLAPAALWEELLFRGYLWTVTADAAGLRVARITTACAFGLVHVMNPGATALSTLLVVIAGVALGAVREWTNSLAATWLAHLAWNWVMAVVVHMPVSGVAFDTPLYRAVVTGPTWWTGGSWGPEGGGAALLVLGSAVWLAYRPREFRPLQPRSMSL